VFAANPTELRSRRHITGGEAGSIELRLPYRPPMRLADTLAFLGHRAIPGLESLADHAFTRTVPLPHGHGLVTLTPGDGFVRARLQLTDHRDLAAAVARIRRLLDLDADPVAVDAVLGQQPSLRHLVKERPGLRSVGTVDGFEMAVRAVVGQQVSVAGARTILGRLVSQTGAIAFDSWRLFPTPEVIAAIDPATLPMPRARGRTIVSLAEAMASRALVLDAGAERFDTRAALLALPGVGPWTADYLLMRAVGDPDVYLGTDLGVKHALAALQHTANSHGAVDEHRAAPWRSYLTHHLWASISDRNTPIR
jgi:AraC family transcriptional regulator of adaptative response / DNA-3-methyladenine glycosylase II